MTGEIHDKRPQAEPELSTLGDTAAAAAAAAASSAARAASVSARTASATQRWAAERKDCRKEELLPAGRLL